MEVLVLREGLALANDLALSRVRMASDCANVVLGMAGSTSGVCQIIKELKEDAAAFQRMEIARERREANFDAHISSRSMLLTSTCPPTGMFGFFICLKAFVPSM